MKHRSAPKEKCPLCLSLWAPLGDTPPIRNKRFMGPCKALKGTDTKVTSAQGHFYAYPIRASAFREGIRKGLLANQAPASVAKGQFDNMLLAFPAPGVGFKDVRF